MPRGRHGFTLIELLLVMLIIGILATIAIPRYARAKEKAFIATVTSDLKIMASQMEIYQAENLTYPADPALLSNFILSAGVTITINETIAGSGWAATGYHSALATRQCGIFFGTGSASNAVPATRGPKPEFGTAQG